MISHAASRTAIFSAMYLVACAFLWWQFRTADFDQLSPLEIFPTTLLLSAPLYYILDRAALKCNYFGVSDWLFLIMLFSIIFVLAISAFTLSFVFIAASALFNREVS